MIVKYEQYLHKTSNLINYWVWYAYEFLLFKFFKKEQSPSYAPDQNGYGTEQSERKIALQSEVVCRPY